MYVTSLEILLKDSFFFLSSLEHPVTFMWDECQMHVNSGFMREQNFMRDLQYVRLMSDLCQFYVAPSSCLKLAGSNMINHVLESGDISKLESCMIWCWESKLPLGEPVGNHPFTPKMFATSSGGTATALVDLCGCKPLHFTHMIGA